jgi:imidazolonepropionase-like amidohydrolase
LKVSRICTKDKTLRTIFIGLSSLFILSLCLLLLLEITSQADIAAGNLKDFDNGSLSLPNIENGNKNEVLVLNGATLIDGNGGPPKSDSIIVINDNNEIIAITSQANFRGNISISTDSEDIVSQIEKRILNVTGKYIMPGLFDMHAHVTGVRKNSYDLARSENMLQMLLDHGVTTVRNPGGPTNESVRLKEEVINGNLRGPEIFTAGRLLNTPEFPVPFVEKLVTTEEEVREEVRNQAAAGVDYIKMYVGLKPELVKAAVDEAHRQGIKVIGHLYLTSWTEAANLGIDFLTHGTPVSPFLLPEREQIIFNRTGGGPFDHTLWLDLVNLNSIEIKNMIDSLVQNQIPVDPTLNVYEEILVRPTFADPQNEQRWSKVLQLTKMMHDRGVKILSGTDIPNFELIPGESLHHELELLVEAGINASDVIEIATKNGAEALDLMNQTGTIEPGKEADILILSANPIDDIKNTKNIEATISNGRIIESSESP